MGSILSVLFLQGTCTGKIKLLLMEVKFLKLDVPRENIKAETSELGIKKKKSLEADALRFANKTYAVLNGATKAILDD